MKDEKLIDANEQFFKGRRLPILVILFIIGIIVLLNDSHFRWLGIVFILISVTLLIILYKKKEL